MFGNSQNNYHLDASMNNSRCDLPSPKVVSSPSHCRDLHQFFKANFARSMREDPTASSTSPLRLYTRCFLCPFASSSESNFTLAGHFYRAHIQPSFRHYVGGTATKVEVLMLFHYACVRDVPIPRLPGYDGIQVVKERNQFYFLHRSYSRGRDVVRPCAKKFAAIAAHVDTLAAREEAWAAKRELRQAMMRHSIATLGASVEAVA